MTSWERSLKASRRAPKTRKSYLDAAGQRVDYLEGHGMPAGAAVVRREHVEVFLAALAETRSPSTVATRYRALQQFFKWLIEEGETDDSPMRNMRPPTIPDAPVEVLSDDDLKRLLATCSGRDFEQRRDAAIIRLLADTGMRRADLAGLRVDDIDWPQDVAVVVGKGRRPRACPFGAKTAQALDRYLRERKKRGFAQLDALWLGVRGAMTDSGIAQVICRRGVEAGLGPIHPHQLRHTFAHSCSRPAATRATSCDSPDGVRGRCSSATPRALLMNGGVMRTGALALAIGSDGRPRRSAQGVKGRTGELLDQVQMQPRRRRATIAA